ncbi:hypothetical protein FQA39_LY14648 [Lamprigera yunnana]|nr:hypothetical protein FQA39_LY14648 [Lamprigera yunnana]
MLTSKDLDQLNQWLSRLRADFKLNILKKRNDIDWYNNMFPKDVEELRLMFEDDETNVVAQNDNFDESDESDSKDHVETRSVDSETDHEISDDEDTEEPEQEDNIFFGLARTFTFGNKSAGEQEKRIAIEKGHVTPEGVPYITVIGDGGWSKRTYRYGYNATSGVLLGLCNVLDYAIVLLRDLFLSEAVVNLSEDNLLFCLT